jgi:spermidine/putrescine-binding protein
LVLLILSLITNVRNAFSQDSEKTLRIFTWDGYVTTKDITSINTILEQLKNPTKIEVIKTFAEGPEQMYAVIRSGSADLSFLTLNYIKMQDEKILNFLQPINTNSPRLSNYKTLLPLLTNIPMGLSNNKPMYVPFGGGAYGLWANMNKLKKEDLPKSLKDLLNPKWKGKISLTNGQVQPNVAMAMLATNNTPFIIDKMLKDNKRNEAKVFANSAGAAQQFLNKLYGQVNSFWGASPNFTDDLLIVASYGPEISALRAKGENWKLIQFKEGNTVWLDTMNIMAHVTGKKLEAAEIFINYFLDNEVQNRVVAGLNMVAVTKNVKNPIIKENPDFFNVNMFWPPYHPIADNLIKHMSDVAILVNKIKN